MTLLKKLQKANPFQGGAGLWQRVSLMHSGLTIADLNQVSRAYKGDINAIVQLNKTYASTLSALSKDPEDVKIKSQSQFLGRVLSNLAGIFVQDFESKLHTGVEGKSGKHPLVTLLKMDVSPFVKEFSAVAVKRVVATAEGETNAEHPLLAALSSSSMLSPLRNQVAKQANYRFEAPDAFFQRSSPANDFSKALESSPVAAAAAGMGG
jgi:hypothetical protein